MARKSVTTSRPRPQVNRPTLDRALDGYAAGGRPDGLSVGFPAGWSVGLTFDETTGRVLFDPDSSTTELALAPAVVAGVSTVVATTDLPARPDPLPLQLAATLGGRLNAYGK